MNQPINPNILFAIFAAITALFLIILLLFRLMINAAICKFISPDLKKYGLIYSGYESVGFWGYGDFRPKDVDGGFSLINTNGAPFIDIYIYIYFKKTKTGTKERITAQIKTAFISVRKVNYSKPLTDLK